MIDDDADVRSALRFAFEADGYEVDAVATGEALLAEPLRPGLTCLVVDQRLPGLSGLETLARLRQRGVTAPAILITTHPSRAVRRIARDAGIDIVEKPLLGDELPRKVSEALTAALKGSGG